jgi:tetratricopeptide (TPR) repeat protein
LRCSTSTGKDAHHADQDQPDHVIGNEGQERREGCLNNLAAIHFARGDSLAAEAFYWWALSNKEKRLGPDYPDVALTLNNLAVLLKSLGKTETAESLYERSLQMFRKSVAPTHPTWSRASRTTQTCCASRDARTKPCNWNAGSASAAREQTRHRAVT